MAGVHERREREDFCLGNVIWCFRRKVREGVTIGGSERGWLFVCLTRSGIDAVFEQDGGMVGIVVVGYRDGTTTLVAGNPRRTRSAQVF